MKVTVEVVFRAVAVASACSVPPIGSPEYPLRPADVDAKGTWTVVPPCTASLGIFVMLFTMPSVLVNRVECGRT